MNPLAQIVFKMVKKQIFKKFDLDAISKYVKEDNPLDDAVRELKLENHELKIRIENLENKD